MKNRFQALLSATPEALGGNGPSAPAEAAVAPQLTVVTTEEAAAGDTPAAEAETKPGYLETIRASLQSKATLLSDRDAYLHRATTAEAQVTILQSDLATANKELATLRAEKSQIEAMVAGLEKEKTTVDLKAAREVAAMGFDAALLPAPDNTVPETAAGMQAKLDAEKDPKKRHELALKLLEMDS